MSLAGPLTAETARVRARYDRISRWYDAQQTLIEGAVRPWRRRLWRHAHGRILEVGVGTGQNFPFYPADLPVTAVDLSPKMIWRARARAERLGLAVGLQVWDVQELPAPDHAFDTAVATFVFCSVPDPVRGLRELARVVRPDGAILLLEHVRIDRPFIGRLMDLLDPLAARVIGAHINRPTVENVRRAALHIEHIESLGPMGMVKLIVAHPPA